MLESELSLAGVSGISLSEDSVTVAGDDSTALERVPDEVSELLIGDFVRAEISDELKRQNKHRLVRSECYLSEPDEDFLVGKTVERSSQTVQSGGEGKVRVRKSRANQVGGVGRDVATFVVALEDRYEKSQLSYCYLRVDGEVKSHELNELGIIESDHVAIVGGPVKAGVSGGKVTVLAVEVVEDLSSDGGKVGNAVHAIFVDIFPVGCLVDTLSVSL